MEWVFKFIDHQQNVASTMFARPNMVKLYRKGQIQVQEAHHDFSLQAADSHGVRMVAYR